MKQFLFQNVRNEIFEIFKIFKNNMSSLLWVIIMLWLLKVYYYCETLSVT